MRKVMELALDEVSMAKNVESQADQYFNAYAELSKTLRTWLVAYGIGAPIVLLTNAGFSGAIRKAGDSKYVAGAFLLGVAAQVALAAINKVGHRGNVWVKVGHFPFKSEAASHSGPSA